MAFMRQFPTKTVEIIHLEGTSEEQRHTVEAHIQPKSGFFAVDTPIYEGDVVVVPDARGGTDRQLAARVEVHDSAPASVRHTEVEWGRVRAPRVAPVRRLGIEHLHPEVRAAASDMFVDGHYSQAVFEALKALEGRVRRQSGLDASGRDLMAKAFSGGPPPIDLSVETGQSGRDEQEGLRLVLMGVIQGIRNPKGHDLVRQMTRSAPLSTWRLSACSSAASMTPRPRRSQRAVERSTVLDVQTPQNRSAFATP